MKYDFDEIIDRSGSLDLKHEVLEERYGRPDLLPLWVADMDFATPPFIMDALRQRLEHPILGYTIEPPEYRPSIVAWLKKLHGVDVRPEWLSFIPGVVKGIGLVINLFTKPGDRVIIQPPVYHPFRLVPEGNGREVVNNPLIECENGTYRMNLEQLEQLAPTCQLLVISNPHNPAGVVWDRETLARVAEICDRHGVLVISDEIHSEMVFAPRHHTPFYSVSDVARRCSITFAAPSKTFNLAGVVSSYSIVADDALRERFYTWLDANELSEPTMFAPIATIAAYTNGEEWRAQMLDYVSDNIDFVADYCEKYLPGVCAHRPEASFLVWLDCRGLKLSQEALVDLFVNRARLALNDGSMFGTEGTGFMRLNVATPRAILREALDRLRAALNL